jgi:aquaporin Z
VPAGHWPDLWIYFTAPLIGMLAAAEVYVRTRGESRVICAKLHHENSRRCILQQNGQTDEKKRRAPLEPNTPLGQLVNNTTLIIRLLPEVPERFR